eukprot:CAMPEP_0183600668 /NCGR_PEP_ID=MMETSP0371-20130417/180055_1 /TAXON_ID=268820 /ORGANISM="Peridinium aciculiferum, Strain PAER-2" /LENGTH=82 /DNA_ID=CAMNT_0025812751 /DNA_START=569 /DNA_END=817 /DNA_ORIENTATION=-
MTNTSQERRACSEKLGQPANSTACITRNPKWQKSETDQFWAAGPARMLFVALRGWRGSNVLTMSVHAVSAIHLNSRNISLIT